MKNVIIGTAGHIDHGKTTLIKAITGTNTDRLKEEQKRGITIELGFTYFDLPSGRRAGIIDVPGHEKFIKNMLAGVVGMDMVILVIAADEGVMPQTKEHLDILNMLGIEKGIVALTKTDMVDEEWLDLVVEDVSSALEGTFLENSQIIKVSSVDKTGIDQLVKSIDDMTLEVQKRDVKDTPRLPIDRVFTLTGFGTIVTGTLIEGMFKLGDEVNIYPSELTSKIRSIQVHGESVQEAYAGQRVAINLAGVKKDEIDRGQVLSLTGAMEATTMLDVKISLLEHSPRIIENRTRVRLYVGSSEVMCRVILLDKENLTPGESAYAQLMLEEEIAVKRKDKFIIRFYSPMTTIGGGEILETKPQRHKRFSPKVIEELELKESGTVLDVLENVVRARSDEYLSIDDLAKITAYKIEKTNDMIKELNSNNKVRLIELKNSIHVIHNDYYEEVKSQIISYVDNFHKSYPLKLGIIKEELRNKVLGNVKSVIFDKMISDLANNNEIQIIDDKVCVFGFEIVYNDDQQKIKSMLNKYYTENKFSPEKRDEVVNLIDYKNEDVNVVFDAMIDESELVRIKDDIFIHKIAYENALEELDKLYKEKNEITLATYRDLLNTSRKYAMYLLELFDQKKITKRLGDVRILH